MTNSRLEYLFHRYMNNLADTEEQMEFMELVMLPENKDSLQALLQQLISETKPASTPAAEAEEAILQAIFKTRPPATEIVPAVSVKKSIQRLRWVAAASIILFLAGGSYLLFFTNHQPTSTPIAKQQSEDVGPGSYKAKLTLSDGSNIVLDNASPGQLVKQGNTIVINKNGELIYTAESNDQSVVYNTISTSKGETYSFVLADGSKVWLNSGSSIHFPVAFPGKERHIEITGEVYVKVAHNPQQPFIASANGMEVLALGTEFNINAYNDEENIGITLIDGVVKVSKGNGNVLLKPGQQTQLLANDEFTKAKRVNVDEVTGWKNGLFHFESADLPTILRQFSRWYDVQITYEGQIPKDRFFVIVNRNSSLSSVLKALQASDVHFRIEGKKLIVKAR